MRRREAEERREAAAGGDANAVPLGQRAVTTAQEVAAQKAAIPDVEWWDARLLQHPESYEEPLEQGAR